MAGTILFDLDGTLVDSAGDLAASLDMLMQEKGKAPIGIDIGRQLIGHGIANLVRSALKLRGARDGEEDSPADLKRFMEIYGSRLTQTTRPYPHVIETLELLAADGWAMAVCTNKRELFARTIVDDLGMTKFFPVVSGPDTFGAGKPDPRHLLEAAKAAGGVTPVLFVGDSEVDVAAAKAARMPVIALTYGYAKTPLASLEPEALVDHFHQIPAAIEDILQRRP